MKSDNNKAAGRAAAAAAEHGGGGDELNSEQPRAAAGAAAAASDREEEEEEEEQARGAEEDDGGTPTKAAAAATTADNTCRPANSATASATATATALSRDTVVSGFAPRSRRRSSAGAGSTTSRPGAYHVSGINSSSSAGGSRTGDASSDVAVVPSAAGGSAAAATCIDASETADVHVVEAMTVPVAPPELAPDASTAQSVMAYSHDFSGDASSLLPSDLEAGSLQRWSSSTFTTGRQHQVQVQVAEPMGMSSSVTTASAMSPTCMEPGSVANNTGIGAGSALSASEARQGRSGRGSTAAKDEEGSNRPIWFTKKYSLPVLALLVLIGIVVGIAVPMASRGNTDSDDDARVPTSPATSTSDAPTAASPTTVDAGAEEEQAEFALYVANSLLDPIYRDLIDGDDNGVLFGDPTSPQSLALDWVVSQDAYSRSAYAHRHCPNVDADAIVLQRYVLAVMYYSTDGTNWDDSLGFLSPDTAVCEWNVYDDAEESLVGVAECGIDVNENTSQTNTAPPSAGDEGVSDTCDGVEMSYSAITSLVLARNGLLGTIPSELGLLSGLKILDLSTNVLESTIPAQLAQVSLTLEQIALGENGLVGSLPPEIFLDATSLRRLSIWGNGLTGTLPTTLGNCSSLEVLSLAINQFSGSLPTEIGDLSNLKDIIIWTNQFTGSIPTELGNCKSLETYSTPDNLMTGSFPTEMGQITNLTTVFAYENMHSGQIPSELGNLPKLEVFNVAINNLSGTLPTEIGQISSLRRFRYFENIGIVGTVPSEITSLPLLEDVWTKDTQLGGPFPSVFHPESSLRSIHVSAGDSTFTGTVPTEIWSLPNLQELEIFNTTMTGRPIPDVLPEGNNVGQMSVMKLSSNGFSGTLPSIIGSFQSLTKLWLQDNVFVGDVPSELSNLQSLVELQIQGNDFDSVPPSMCNLRNASGGGLLETYVSDCDEVGCTCCTECL